MFNISESRWTMEAKDYLLIHTTVSLSSPLPLIPMEDTEETSVGNKQPTICT